MATLLTNRWMVWAAAALFVLYDYVLNTSVATLVPMLISMYKLNALQAGHLSAFYLYAYAPMMIIIGLILDRFGPRKVLVCASIVCALGCFLFGIQGEYGFAVVGRLLMGLGSPAAWLGLVHISAHWFPLRRLGLMVGLGGAVALVGAAIGEGPLSTTIAHLGWQGTFFSLGILGIILALFVFATVRDVPPRVADVASDPHLSHAWTKSLGNLLTIGRKLSIWFSSFAALTTFVVTTVFAGLWAVPFLMSTYGITSELAGYALSLFFFGGIIGGPLICYISDRLGKRKAVFIFSSALSLAVLIPVIYLKLSLTWVFALLFALGVLAQGSLLCYPIVVGHSPVQARSSASGAINFIVNLGGAVLQPLVGGLLDVAWKIQEQLGVRLLSPDSYRLVFSVFPLGLALSILFMSLVKEPQTAPQGALNDKET